MHFSLDCICWQSKVSDCVHPHNTLSTLRPVYQDFIFTSYFFPIVIIDWHVQIFYIITDIVLFSLPTATKTDIHSYYAMNNIKFKTLQWTLLTLVHWISSLAPNNVISRVLRKTISIKLPTIIIVNWTSDHRQLLWVCPYFWNSNCWQWLILKDSNERTSCRSRFLCATFLFISQKPISNTFTRVYDFK